MANITMHDYLTASGRYKERLNNKELTDEARKQATMLLHVVNCLLNELGVGDVRVSSGWRPEAANKAANGAKKSLHMTGLAIDLEDDEDQSLASLIENSPELLEKYGLWLESPEATKGKNTNWVHLDKGTRKARKIRIFMP